MKKQQTGLSLVEVLVAITISLILLAGIVQIFTSSKATYLMQEGLARVQENGRFALSFIGSKVRSAGYRGCSTGESGTLTNTVRNSSTNPFNFTQYIEGYEATPSGNSTGVGDTYTITATNPSPSSSAGDWSASGGGSSSSLPSDLVGEVIPGTDVLVLRGALGDPVKIDRNNSSAQVFIEENGTQAGACPGGTTEVSGLCENDIVVVTDCNKSRVFQITGITVTGGGSCSLASSCANLDHSGSSNPGPGNQPSSWGGSSAPDDEKFGPGAEILKMSTHIFYVGQGASGEPALFYRENNGTSQELVTGVDSMQIVYGEDTDAAGSSTSGLANRYVPADQVGDFDDVVSARVSLLLRSDNAARTQPDSGTYMLAGATTSQATTIDPVDDQRIRRVYSATFKLRNRGVR